MAYREVTMVDVKEVLRLWLAGVARKRIAACLGLDAKTVRRYVRTAERAGLRASTGEVGLTDEQVAVVTVALKAVPTRPHGAAWMDCVRHEAIIAGHLKDRVRLTKIRKLLRRQGVTVPYATLRRFAIAVLGFGSRAATVPVADGSPGEEVQLDTGWMTLLAPEATGRRRRFRAWIFTAVYSRYRFVYPCFQETTASAIDACEAAWAFFGGIFAVLIPELRRDSYAGGHITQCSGKGTSRGARHRKEVVYVGALFHPTRHDRPVPLVVDRRSDRAVRGVADLRGLRRSECL
jgi:hypothetical protein